MTKLETLLAATADGKTVSFVYDDKQRVVEIHAIGFSTKDGSVIMRGYQVAGEASRPLPAWSLFTVEKMDALQIGFIDSEAPRPGYKENDKQMSSIIAQYILAEAA